MEAGPWNSLEIAKLFAGLITPATLALLGVYIHHVTKKFEHMQWRSQKLIEKRLSIYDDIAPDFNDLLCYFTYIGCWKELDPPKVLTLKRKLDKKIHLASPLFSDRFFSACMEFQCLCFDTYSGWGKDALIKSKFRRRQEAAKNEWKLEWDNYFSDLTSDPDQIKLSYKKIMHVLADEIGVNQMILAPETGDVPGEIS